MRNLFLFIVVLFCSFQVKAQASKEESVSAKKTAVKSLNQVYAAKVLNAYQENSKSKVEDLFYYFQLLTDASLTDDLKKEIVKNINLLYKNQNEKILDFTSETYDTILLAQFIQKLLISEPILFSVSSQSNYNSVDYQSWKIGYTVVRTKSGLEKKSNVTHKVYFIEVAKQFGDDKKEVTETFFGAME